MFDCAFRSSNGTRSIHYMGHIRMMAAVQPFLSGAISKTVNLPTDCTVEDIEDAYIQAWKIGLKAIAVYRDGCKRTQPLSTTREEATSNGALLKVEAVLQDEEVLEPPRPRGAPAGRGSARAQDPARGPAGGDPLQAAADERSSFTHKFSIGGHEGYITVGLYEDGQPGEIFVRMAKEGSVIAGLMDSFATAVIAGAPARRAAADPVDKFKGTRFEPSGFTGNQEIPIATSIMDYLFRWLSLRFLGGDEALGERHPAARRGASSTCRDPAACPKDFVVRSRSRARAIRRHDPHRDRESTGPRLGAGDRRAAVPRVRHADGAQRRLPQVPELRLDQRLLVMS